MGNRASQWSVWLCHRFRLRCSYRVWRNTSGCDRDQQIPPGKRKEESWYPPDKLCSCRGWSLDLQYQDLSWRNWWPWTPVEPPNLVSVILSLIVESQSIFWSQSISGTDYRKTSFSCLSVQALVFRVMVKTRKICWFLNLVSLPKKYTNILFCNNNHELI